MKLFGLLLAIIGLLTAGLATITSIGYFLYLCGSVGLAVAPSAWAGFLLFVKMLVSGIMALFTGLLISGENLTYFKGNK